MKAKTTFLARSILSPPTSAPRSPHDDGSGLQTRTHGGKIGPHRPIIWWMWVRSYRCVPTTASSVFTQPRPSPDARWSTNELRDWPVDGRRRSDHIGKDHLFRENVRRAREPP